MRLCAVFGLCLAILALAPARAQTSPRVLVFAAASLTDAMTAVGAAYAATGNPAPVFSFAASSTLARQIENGAPAALFISADEEWMDYLDTRALIDPDSRASFLRNSLVLIVPKGVAWPTPIAPGFELAAALEGRKLAMADPDAVPAGRYGRAALEALEAWSDVAPFVVRADNVRAALTFVERKEVAAGVVYATDAAASARVDVVGAFPAGSHPPISYPMAIVAAHDSREARAFRAFLLQDTAKAIYRRFGFTVP